MTNRDDSAYAAHPLIELALSPSTTRDDATRYLAAAHTYAELAKAEQQRVTNLLLLLTNSATPTAARDTAHRQLFSPETGQFTTNVANTLNIDPDSYR